MTWELRSHSQLWWLQLTTDMDHVSLNHSKDEMTQSDLLTALSNIDKRHEDRRGCWEKTKIGMGFHYPHVKNDQK